jgi:hypothetical protein
MLILSKRAINVWLEMILGLVCAKFFLANSERIMVAFLALLGMTMWSEDRQGMRLSLIGFVSVLLH